MDAAPPRFPRWANQLWAAVFGFFWLPCPICGTYFGGHEYDATWWYGYGGTGICWKHGGDFTWIPETLPDWMEWAQ